MTPTDPPQPEAEPDDPGTAPLGAGLDFTDPNSPLAPYYLRASHVVAVFLLAAVGGLYTLLPIWHTDVWGHLAFGRWIVNHGLPDREPLCPFADHDALYVNFQWLTQAGLYLLYAGGARLAGGDTLRQTEGGVEALHAAHVLLAIACYALLMAAYRRRGGGSLPLACAGVVVLLVLSPWYLTIFRPQVLGVVLFAAVMVPLSRPALSRRALVLLPLLFALWANVHGSYAVGLVLLAVCLAGRVVEAWWGTDGRSFGRAWHDDRARRLLLAVGLATAACCLNPHGPMLFLHTVRLGRHPNIATFEEWQPLKFFASVDAVWSYPGAALVLAVSVALAPRRVTVTTVLLLLVFGGWPLLQQRALVWWLALVPWLAVPLWAAAAERPAFAGLRVESVLSFRKTLLAVVIVAAAVPWWGPVRWLINRRPRPLDRAITAGTPWKVAAQLNEPDGPWMPDLGAALRASFPDGRLAGSVFTTETQGDYLLWALPPETPVTVYSHIHLFGAAHWRDSLTVKAARPGWAEILDRDGVNLMVFEVESHAELAAQIRANPRWRVVLDEAGDRAKRDPRTRLLVALRREPLRPTADRPEGRP